MTGRMVAAGTLAFGAGWFCGVANHVRRCWPTILGLTRRLSEADTCHDCATAVGRLSAELAAETRERARHAEAADYFARVVAAQRDHIEWQEHRIDQLEHEQARDGFDPVAEAQQILDRGEAGS
jgi:hypothetical protein